MDDVAWKRRASKMIIEALIFAISTTIAIGIGEWLGGR